MRSKMTFLNDFVVCTVSQNPPLALLYCYFSCFNNLLMVFATDFNSVR